MKLAPLAPIALVLAALGAAAGCAHTSPQAVVARHASGELSCPASQLDVTGIGGTAYKATGCGRSATYSCGDFADVFDATCRRAPDPASVVGVTEPQGR